ncbi:MAG: DUF4023 family protein [Candidatus Pristimantibacillus lignocellulolyticus]|uniref:DUF4023 family protein n=1 Tax=Candidatus Pristimantibacillus lignocellulolyticus TaxID=2994561 RepID=A0A9J6ZH25_9BACL|nr:MAG: DUF4023 family protein [Candidatus Pristimantibacillus lignocellulolyticus]
MDSTKDFVEKIHEQQESNNKGSKKKDAENGGHKLPGKQHGTNK